MARLSQSIDDTAWGSLYPFESHSLDIDGCAYHYIDESPPDTSPGDVPTLLFVHGNPTWSFHWRRLIQANRDQYRCVAPDHLGCGLSDLQPRPLRLADHIDNLVKLIETLDLRRVTLVAQDWGGAIGLGAVLHARERFERLALYNTGAFPPWFIPWRIRVCRWPVLGRLALQGANGFSRAALRMTLSRRRRLDPLVEQAYLAPYHNWQSRAAVHQFVQDIPLSDQHPTWQTLAEIERGLPELASLPQSLVWGMRDWCFTPECLDKLVEHWPQAEVHRLADVGHWVVEDAPEEVEQLLAEWLQRTATSVSGRFIDVMRGPIMPSLAVSPPTTIGACATLACLWEATAPKPGNVYRGADFEDLTYVDFLTSAAVIGPVLEQAAEQGVGATVLEAVRRTRAAVATNTNLGMLLLLAPLAAVPTEVPLDIGIGSLFASLTGEDAKHVFEAIRTAQPGGLGKVDEADVNDTYVNDTDLNDTEAPEISLLEAMQLAADRDLIARQYTNDFQQVFQVATHIEQAVHRSLPLSDAIVHAFLQLLAEFPDSLIARKCGEQVAREVSIQAAAVLSQGQPGEAAYENALQEFDFSLRIGGHRRNPGTSADLIAAALFVLLREQRLQWPIKFYHDLELKA